jgi:hypothetical protein
MKKNATTKTKKDTKNTGKVPSKKVVVSNTQKTTKAKPSAISTSKCTGTKIQNTSKTAKNTPKKARERVTVSNYQKLAMRTCLPQCKCLEYAIPELLSEWHEALAKIEGTRAKLVRMDANSMPSKSLQEWLDGKRNEIKEELGDIFWSLALVCELKKESFSDTFRNTNPTRVDGFRLPFWFFPERDGNELFIDVSTQISTLKRICQCLMIKASDCLEANIRKLAKRQAEGKIQGDGDER